MLPLVVALNVAATVGVEDRTEVRGRIVNSPRVDPATSQPNLDTNQDFKRNDNATTPVFDVETDPVGRLRVFNDRTAFTLGYAPRIVIANFSGGGLEQGAGIPVGGVQAGKSPGSGVTFDFIHRPALTLEHQLSRVDRFVANGLVQFGSTTPGTLLLPDRWNGEDRPAVPRAFPVLPFAKQTFLSVYAAAGVAHTFSDRFSMTVSAFYITFGQPTQAGRVAAGGTTYLQNPGVNLELEYKARPTDTFTFNLAPQVNIVQASPVETDQYGNIVGEDGQLQQQADGNTPNLFDTINRPGVKPRYVNRKAPNTYQLLLEARYKKQVARLTSYELAVGANVIQQSIPQASVPYYEIDYVDAGVAKTGRVSSIVASPYAGPGALALPDGVTRVERKEETLDDPFGLYGRDPAQRRASKSNFNLLPVGEVLVNYGFASGSAQGRLIAFTRADAWLNTVSGDIGARSSTVAAINFDFGLDALRAQAAFVQSLPLSDRTTAFRQVIAEVSYEREITRQWFFDIGARAGFQDAEITKTRADGTGGFRTSFFQPGAFAGIAWRPLPAKL